MQYPLRHLFALLGLALIVLVPLGCGDDDPTDPGNTAPTDQTAPLVMGIAPIENSDNVPVDEAVVVVFSEAMDKDTADGNVTLSSGAIATLDWNAAGTELAIQHADWPEGEAVTVTVGTGLTDVAGNALPQAFGTFFYTYSSVPVMLDTMLPGGEGSMLINGDPQFLFSAPMNVTSVATFTSVDEGAPKAVPNYTVHYGNAGLQSVVVDFQAPLDPLTTYTITIGADAETQGGTPLGTSVVTTFTTGADADETGPQILSVTPAVDAVVPADLESFTVTFTEPVDVPLVRPTEMSALLELFLAREPVWNATYDAMTLYLQQPLPAGMRLYAIFGENSMRDLVGNFNATTDSVSFTTQGTASLFPVRGDLKIYYSGYSSEGQGKVPSVEPTIMARQTVENISGANFNRVVNTWGGTAFDELFDSWQMTMDNGGLHFRGATDDTGPLTFSPALSFLALPLQEMWTGTSTGSKGGENFTMSYGAYREGPYRRELYLGGDKIVGTRYYLDGCHDVEVNYTMAAGEVVFETGTIVTMYAPGLGIYSQYLSGAEYEDELVVDAWADVFEFEGAALDDRLEQPDF